MTNLELLQAAKEVARLASQRSLQVNDFPLKVILDGEIEGSQWSTALASQAIGLLLGLVHRLTHGVQYIILEMIKRRHYMRHVVSTHCADRLSLSTARSRS